MLDGGVETMMRPSEGVVGLDPLAARLADGDPRAARDLVEGHYAGLYRYAFAMLRGEQDAEDAVQDAFERALTTLGRYPEERIRAIMLRAWVYRITLNMVRNRLRRNREAPVGGDPGTLSGMPGTGIGERREDVMDVLATLGRLPERQRVALALRHLQDLPYAEICAATGWPSRALGISWPWKIQKVACHAICRNARRILPENRLPFRSVSEATAAGFRPCKVCRPVAVA